MKNFQETLFRQFQFGHVSGDVIMIQKEAVGIESFHSRGKHLNCIKTKGSDYIRKEFTSHVNGLEHQHGRCFIVLEHQYGHRDVT